MSAEGRMARQMGADNAPQNLQEAPKAPEGELSGQVWLMTGTGDRNGIGATVARMAGLRGAKLFLTSTERSQSDGMALADELNGQGIEAAYQAADLIQPSTSKELVADAVSTFGKIDGLVSFAGKRYDALFVDTTDEDWQKGMEINLFGPLRLVREVISQMKQQTPKGGFITLGASAIAEHGNLGQTIYGAAKAAQVNVVQALAPELRRDKIRVNAVMPGLVIETPMTKNLTPRQIQRVLEFSGRDRPVTREEVAEAVIYTASKRSMGVNGEKLIVLGGEDYAIRDLRQP